MAVNEIHLNDIGLKFEITVVDGTTPVDLGGHTTMALTFRKPDGTKLEVAATVDDAGTGSISYTTLLDDLDQVGRWKIQLHTVIPGYNLHSDVGEFTVYANL